MKLPLAITFACLAALGCEGKIAVTSETPMNLGPARPGPQEPTPVPQVPTPQAPENLSNTAIDRALADIPAEEATHYLRAIAQMLVARPLNSSELDQLQAQGGAAIRPIVQAWTTESGFVESARYMMQQKLRASGDRDGIDFEAPGRLVAHVVANNRPFSEIVTADYCVAADGSQQSCDSGAPYNAGVLTTRAFLAGNAGRFNLGRASRLLKVFACRAYPMDDNLQPYLPKETLIPMFRASNAAEQTVEEAKAAFGNGDACYMCHGQFGAHAQFFVKFDQTGIWRAEANGMQDPTGELGRSVDGLMTSHMEDPTAKAFEGSKMFGQDVANLREAAQVLAQNDVFVPCMVRNVVEYTFGMTDSEGDNIDQTLLAEIALRASKDRAIEPTFADIVLETFVDTRVIEVVLNARGDLP